MKDWVEFRFLFPAILITIVVFTVWVVLFYIYLKPYEPELSVHKIGRRYIVTGPPEAFKGLTSEQFDEWDRKSR